MIWMFWEKVSFPLFYLSEPNKSNYIKIFFSQSIRFILEFWYLTWFVKLIFTTVMERKYICVKFPFFTSTQTAKVLEKGETCILYFGMLYVNLEVWFSPVHQDSFLGDQRWIAVLDLESRFGPGQSDAGEDGLSSELSFPFLLPSHLSSSELLCWSIQGTLSHHPHSLNLLPDDLLLVWIILLGPSFICNGSSDTR